MRVPLLKYKKLVATEKKEHKWLTDAQAKRVVNDHLRKEK